MGVLPIRIVVCHTSGLRTYPFTFLPSLGCDKIVWESKPAASVWTRPTQRVVTQRGGKPKIPWLRLRRLPEADITKMVEEIAWEMNTMPMCWVSQDLLELSGSAIYSISSIERMVTPKVGNIYVDVGRYKLGVRKLGSLNQAALCNWILKFTGERIFRSSVYGLLKSKIPPLNFWASYYSCGLSAWNSKFVLWTCFPLY